MVISNSAFTLFFPENKNIRENFFKMEEHFQDFQHPFTLVTLPMEAPPEIPRILAATKNGHSQLTISCNRVQLLTHYDGEYPKNLSKCLNYTTNKVLQIIDAMPLIDGMPEDNQKYYYSGLSMDMIYDETDGIDNPVEYINNIHVKDSISLPIDELQCRFALVVENQYYVNIILQNRKTFEGIPDERGSLAGLREGKEALVVSLDINDRYAFNNVKNYVSGKENIIRLASIMERFANKYLPNYLKSGEINYVAE